MPALFPSTYKQVVKNMEDILNQLNVLNMISEKINGYDDKFTEVSTKLDSYDEKFTEVSSKIDEFGTEFDTISASVDTINNSITNINQELETINTSIAKIGDLSDLPYDSVAELGNKVVELEKKILDNTDPGTSKGDIVNTDDGMKVIGVHMNTTNVTENTTINNYTQGITYEIKSTEAIGLKDKTGVSGAYCMLVTFKQDATLTGETAVSEFVPFQVAYGTDGMIMYKRTANTTDDTWNEWETTEVRTQIIETEDNTEPAADVQIAGEYWMENLT